MDCCKNLCAKGIHCWLEGPEIKMIGSEDWVQHRKCRHCKLTQIKEWRNNP